MESQDRPLRFALAPMSPAIKWLTLLLLALPFAFFGGGLVSQRILLLPALFIVATYAWIWLRFRPQSFIVRDRELEVVWPWKRRSIARDSISGVQLLDARALRAEIGWGMRVGAGGLWGGFGWLWTTRRGIVQMYVSRTDGLVWIERANERPWLITPERPEEFVTALTR
jgi:signal transduction histidine kinase